jgi:hypothetical protein
MIRKRRWAVIDESRAKEALERSGQIDLDGCVVYALLDSSRAIRYVGCTEKGLEYRLIRHLGFARQGKPWRVSTWLRSVEYEITVQVLAHNPPNEKALELAWIHWVREEGEPLVNYKGTPATKEHRAKITAANLRRWADPKRREHLAEQNRQGITGMLGRRHSLETRERIGASLRARGGE